MPIYMDRHDLSGVTVEDIAKAHQLDVNIAPDFKCKTLTYWFDEGKQIVFCLIDAPDKNAVQDLHRNSHGSVPNHIIEVECNVVEIFLGRISNPELSEQEKYISESAYRTTMKLDLYQLKNSNTNRTTESFNFHKEIFSSSLKLFEGREIENFEDGFLASFISAPNAVKCAIEIQEKINQINTEYGYNIEGTIALNTGCPVTESEEFFGDTIKLVNRLSYIGTGGQIIISSSTNEILNRTQSFLTKNGTIKILSSKQENFLNQFMDLIELNWNNDSFKIENFSRQIALSKAQLYRKVTSLTGCSLNEFIRNYRLKRALKLLNENNGNISEVAFEAGFNNASYFSKCFQKKYGILPSEYVNSIV